MPPLLTRRGIGNERRSALRVAPSSILLLLMLLVSVLVAPTRAETADAAQAVETETLAEDLGFDEGKVPAARVSTLATDPPLRPETESPPPAPVPTPHLVGNAAAGAIKSAVCAGCHGPDGNAMAPAWPKLAGQRADYIAKQLKDFREGRRMDPIMSGMAAALSEQDRADVAAHFAQQQIRLGTSDPELARIGERLYRNGRSDDQLLPCIGCHGSNGEGFDGSIEGGFPALGGQNAEYVAKQLESFRSGSRTNDWQRIMQVIASKLSDRDIAALTAYLAGLSRKAEPIRARAEP